MIRRLAWLTDIHLNFLPFQGISLEAFVENLNTTEADAFCISGDIGEAPSIIHYLEFLALHISRPIYFVLGNHDFYRGSISEVRARVKNLCSQHPNLVYLSHAAVIELTPEIGFVGHDGWADLQFGDFMNTTIWLNDHVLIYELAVAGLSKSVLRPIATALGNEAANHFKRNLPIALEKYQHVFVLTHVPPFKEACWHEGRISDDNWLPHFTCKAVGDVLREVMLAHPDYQLTVLCGHTHGQGAAQILPNLRVLTGGAEYGSPTIQQNFELTS